jgi:glucosamine--fructose-6-phosphate aminotransferase (isomerizing)
MCGIVGYVGGEQAAPIVLESLSRLEYRGYDSAGVAILDREGGLCIAKSAGKLSVLQSQLEGACPVGTTGIGHTRWATHGRATDANAHPHTDASGDVVVIHNGIVENHRELRAELAGRGDVFLSETDTEVIPHLIAEAIAEGLDLEAATRRTIARLEGAAAIVALHGNEPGVLVAARIANAGGVVIGYGDDAMYVASDLPAILPYTRRVAFLDDGDIARITCDGATFTRVTGEPIAKEPEELSIDAAAIGKGVYAHYMAKEIAEQPEAVLDTLRGVAAFDPPAVDLPDLGLSDADLAAVQHVVLIGMGTSYHGALIGRTYIEQLTGLAAEVDNASEYRYRRPILDDSTLLIAVGQSGETVDTLAAMHEARERGAKVLTVCNTPGSQATRVAHGSVFMRCGPEVAVASTKTFLGSLTALYLLACRIGRARGFLDDDRLGAALNDLARLPGLVGEALKTERAIKAIAARFSDAQHFLFLGRGLEYAVAMEGALKLKEVSYIHAEGYAAGEMKHGPIALIDASMPVVALALQDEHYTKMLSNIEEVRAREGRVIAIATAGDTSVSEKAEDVVYLPPAPALLQPLLTAVPLQFLAYHIALNQGRDIDQPRNLAKTVTVE